MLARNEQIEGLLVARGVEAAAIKRARSVSQASGVDLLRVLNQMGDLGDDTLSDLLCDLCSVPQIRLVDFPETLPQTPIAIPFMRARQIAPYRARDGRIDVALVNPLDADAMSGIRFALREQFGSAYIVTAGDWKKLFSLHFDKTSESDAPPDSIEEQVLVRLFDNDRDAPVARRVASLLSNAVERGASDIHIESRRNRVDVRYRIDGRLEHVAEEPASAGPGLIARVKVLADLDLGERRRPQDGRTTIVVAGRPIDVRVSIVPAAEGESAVLRLLNRPDSMMSLSGLGFSEAHCDAINRIIASRDGLFLVSGPTGSGKTTTLYACLQSLEASHLKIVSVEDPIEYHFEHVTQVQANEAAGVDFPTALRSFLRHDPDVIFVGEIRDRETAAIAVQAALTGHLVVATIHAIDADRIVARLIDMGVDRFQLDAALRAAMSQRLVRGLCRSCASSVPIDPAARQAFVEAGLAPPGELWEPQGCEACNQSGYRGRLVIAEMSSDDQQGMLQDGLLKAAEGLTTLAEVQLAVDSK